DERDDPARAPPLHHRDRRRIIEVRSHRKTSAAEPAGLPFAADALVEIFSPRAFDYAFLDVQVFAALDAVDLAVTDPEDSVTHGEHFVIVRGADDRYAALFVELS